MTNTQADELIFPFREARRLALYYTGSWREDMDYDDMLAEVVLQAWRAWQRLGSRYTLRTYIKHAARYQPLGWKRSARAGHLMDGFCRKVYSVEPAAIEIDLSSPDDPAAVAMDRLAWWEEVGRGTSRRDLEIILRAVVWQQTEAEIAGSLGIGKGAVGHALLRAYDRVRRRNGVPPRETPRQKRPDARRRQQEARTAPAERRGED